ncbi:MAG: oligosaccharide flippase family protein, partial [Planctomycetota bacterium]
MFGTFRDLLKTRTARHTFTLFIGSLASKSIAFGLLFWLARLLDRHEYDLFAVAWTIMLIVYEFTELGMNVTLVRHAAARLGGGEPDRAAGLFRLAASLKAALFVVVF